MATKKTSSIQQEPCSDAKEYVGAEKQADLKFAIYNKVMYHLNEKQIFLDPKLSLVSFSSIVGTNTLLY